MVAAMLLIISVVALGQFAVYYWRAVLSGVASQPVSARVQMAAGLAGSPDFDAYLNLYEVTPSLAQDQGELRAVRTYYRVVGILGRIARLAFPQLASWTEREMATCTRYVAVLLDRRLERNLACAAEMRSCY